MIISTFTIASHRDTNQEGLFDTFVYFKCAAVDNFYFRN